MSQKKYQDNFLPDVWSTLSTEDRVNTLQDLENDYADRYCRQPYTVVSSTMDGIGSCAVIDHEKNIIEINEDHINKNSMICMAVHSTLHEGYHAYQKAAIDNDGLHRDNAQVQRWRANSNVYIPYTNTSYIAYKLQALERDANTFADTELNNIYARHEITHGKIAQYRKFDTALIAERTSDTIRAIENLGFEYEERIDRAIDREYQKSISKLIDKDGSKKLSKEVQSRTYQVVVELPDKRQYDKLFNVDQHIDGDDLKRALKAEAKDFLNQTAIRRGIPPDDIQQVKISVNKASLEQASEFEKQRTNLKERVQFINFKF